MPSTAMGQAVGRRGSPENEVNQGHSARLQLVVPYFLRKQILQELHAGPVNTHLGGSNTVENKVAFTLAGYAPRCARLLQHLCYLCYMKDVPRTWISLTLAQKQWSLLSVQGKTCPRSVCSLCYSLNRVRVEFSQRGKQCSVV